MRNQPETLHEYNIPRLHWWFLFSGALFIICIGLMIWVDYSDGEIRWLGIRGDRSWKLFQREYYVIDKRRLAVDVRASEVRAQEEGLEKVLAELAQATRELADKRVEEAAATADADKLKVTADLITRQHTMQKALRDQFRSSYDEALERANLNLENPEVVAWRAKVEAQNEFVSTLELDKQQADANYAAAKAKLDAIIGYELELEKKKSRLEATTVLMQKRLDQLTNTLVQAVVNAPLIEFAAGNYKVEQIIAENHHVNVNFATVPRVDRCITCHKAIERKDLTPEELDWRAKHKIEAVEWSKLPQPLTSHPRLDLFVGETSPHPSSTYGCTVCHWGWDRETTFSRAGHTPGDHKQEVEWKKKYHWEHQEFLVQPMRASKYVQAGCLKCHTEQTNLPGADKLDHGRRLIGQLGCWSCHKMKQLETYSTHRVAPGDDFDSICKFYDVEPEQVRRLNNLPREVSLSTGQELSIPIRILHKDGPSLYKVASKTNKEWMRKWLADPVAFRHNTYMPRFWGLSNNHDPPRDAVEMNAITEFLFAASDRPQYLPPPVNGIAQNGKTLVGQLGCLGCHVIDEKLMDLKVPPHLRQHMDDWDYRRARTQGPQLAGAGSKTTINWLYAWLKNPKQYHPQTKMPSLRLSDQEAADIAEYLASLRIQHTDQQSLAEVDTNELDAVTLEYLQNTLPLKQAQEKINNLDDLIERYFAPEDVQPYFDDATRLVREEAQQAALKKKYEDEFDEAVGKQADQLAAHIADVQAKLQRARQRAAALDPQRKKNVYLGGKLVARYGCFGCHDIHGFETAKPIGTELSEWGSKPVNKLDFGLLPIEHDRIAWLRQKLGEPRSYDEGRVGITRTPQELLKMPKFNLSEEQMDQIVTFVSGMTDEIMTFQEPRQLSPAEFHIERGRWLVKELNCVGCHVVEARGGAIQVTGIPAGMEPPMISGTPTQLQQGQRTQPDWLFEFLKAPQTGEVRPWLKVRMPTFGLSDGEANILVRYFALDGRTQFPYRTPLAASAESLTAGKQLFEQLKCALCHIVEGKALGKPLAEIPEEDLPRLAPDLNLAHTRLQRDWLVHKWLPAPLEQVPGTRMPQFEYGTVSPKILGGDSLKQREALSDYLLSLGAQQGETAQAAPATAAKQP